MNKRRRFKAKGRRAKAARVRLYVDRYIKTLRFHPDAFSLVGVGCRLHPCGCDAAGPITGSRCGTCGAEIHGLVTTT